MADRILIIPDTHCPGMLPGFPDFLYRTYKKYTCNRVIHIGDLVDWHAINFHGKEPNAPSVRDEIKRGRRQVAQLYKRFPEADWLLGNHDCLPIRRLAEIGLPEDALISPADYWGVPTWKVHERYAQLIVDGVVYSHGESGPGGQYAAMRQATQNFQSTVIGHYHASAGVWWLANPNFLIFGMAVGCGIDHKKLQFTYGRAFLKKPIVGCGVVLEGRTAFFEPMSLQ